MPARTVISGEIGKSKLNLILIPTIDGKDIKGEYKNKPINIKLKRGVNNFSLISDKTNVLISRTQLFSGTGTMEGKYREHDDLFPIFLNEIYCMRNAEISSLASILAGY